MISWRWRTVVLMMTGGGADAGEGAGGCVMFLTDIGTATNQWDDKNYNDGPDVCQGNVVMNNFIDTQVKKRFYFFLLVTVWKKQCFSFITFFRRLRSKLLGTAVVLFFSVRFDCAGTITMIYQVSVCLTYIFCLWLCLWVINVATRVAHCRVANAVLRYWWCLLLSLLLLLLLFVYVGCWRNPTWTSWWYPGGSPACFPRRCVLLELTNVEDTMHALSCGRGGCPYCLPRLLMWRVYLAQNQVFKKTTGPPDKQSHGQKQGQFRPTAQKPSQSIRTLLQKKTMFCSHTKTYPPSTPCTNTKLMSIPTNSSSIAQMLPVYVRLLAVFEYISYSEYWVLQYWPKYCEYWEYKWYWRPEYCDYYAYE